MKDIVYSELLQLIIKQGIIIPDDVQKLMLEEERKEILKHHPYKIFIGSDGRVKTYLPDPTKKSGRKLIAKKTLEKIEDAIIDNYHCTNTNKDKKITLRTIYPEWLDYKSTQTDSTSYVQRIHCDWRKYYEGTELIDKPIEELTYLYLNKWAYNLIKRNNLTKNQYYNITVIVRQCLDYCTEPEIGIIEKNPFERVKFKGKMFRKRQQPASATQVFSDDEKQKIISLALNKYNRNPKYTTALAIVLNFTLGLRLGELCALKKSDIEGRHIKIQRSSIKDYEVVLSDEIQLRGNGNRIIDHVKSPAGERTLYLTDAALKVIELVEESNERYGYYDDGFLFISCNNKRIAPSTISNYLWKLCKEVGIDVPKGNHKIRKTFISSLFDARININTIREIAGHESEQTSLRNYCFDRSEKTTTEMKLDMLSNSIKIS